MPITMWNPNAILGPARAAFRPAALGVKRQAQAEAPGASVARGIRVYFTSPTSAQVRSHHKATGPIVKGQKAHEIRPRVKKALSGGPLDHPVAGVEHPGARPNPFLQRGAARFPLLYAAEARRRLPQRRV